MVVFARILILGGSLALLLLGVWILVAGEAPIAGLLTGLIGAGGLLAITLERMRYRALEADRLTERTAGAGGEQGDGSLDPRFRRTDEVFVDPTTRRRMRVFVDTASGERRYVPDR
jgi:hypothetical protein